MLPFSAKKMSCISFYKFIPKYLMFFAATGMLWFLKFVNLFPIHALGFDFSKILLINSFISSGWFFADCIRFSMETVISFVNDCSKLLCINVYAFFLTVTYGAMLNRNGESRHPWFSISPWNMMLGTDVLLQMPFIRLRSFLLPGFVLWEDVEFCPMHFL